MADYQSSLEHRRSRESAKRRTPTLRSLDRRTVEIRLSVRGEERVILGKGAYESDPRLGGVLRIHCHDSAGSFEILIRECQWKGEISRKRGAADFSITLDPAGK